jgi:FkbM family methyltransferase
MDVEKITFKEDENSILHYFPETYISTLCDSFERKINIFDQFKNYNVSYTLCNFRKYDEYYPDKIIETDQHFRDKIRIGNLLGFIKMIKYWVDNSESQYAFFGEDDLNIDVCKYWNFKWDEFFHEVPKDFDVLQMCVIKEPRDLPFLETSLHEKRVHDWCVTGFILTRRYAEALVSEYCVTEHEYKIVMSQDLSGATPENYIFRHDNWFYEKYTNLHNNMYSVPLFTEEMILSKNKFHDETTIYFYKFLKSISKEKNNLDYFLNKSKLYFYDSIAYKLPISVSLDTPQIIDKPFIGYQTINPSYKDKGLCFYNLIKSDDNYTIVDINSGCGFYNLLSKYVPNSVFYAYEPDEYLSQINKDNILLNDITNVHINKPQEFDKIDFMVINGDVTEYIHLIIKHKPTLFVHDEKWVQGLNNYVSYEPHIYTPVYSEYETDDTVTELHNYHNNYKVFFKLFKMCQISDCIRRGYRWEEHQHDLIDKYVRDDFVVLEGGANIGTLTVKLSKVAKEVYAFEPVKETFNVLKQNLEVNMCKNVHTINEGLGAEKTRAYIRHMGGYSNPGGTAITTGFGNMLVTTIDSLGLDKLDYIKLDIEGHEESALLKGGIETIKRCMPIIVVEYWLYTGTPRDIHTSYKVLIDLGYTIHNVYHEDFILLPPPKIIHPSTSISNTSSDLIIINNFYNDPDSIREYALSLDFMSEDKHGAVGWRCENGRKIIDGTKEFFEKVLDCKIPDGTNHGEWGYYTNGCFQWCNKDVRRVWHRDSQDYAAIIYLTPDAPPNCGTSFWRHRKYKSMDGNFVFSKDDWKDLCTGDDSHIDPNPWEEVDRAGNVYNRLVIFNASQIHAVTEYFGNDINDSRLFQLFFFNIHS